MVLKKTLNDIRAHVRLATWLGLGCLAASVGSLLLLMTLDYSSVRLVPAEAAEANRRPTPDFSIGPLTWPVTELSTAPQLEPFRRAFRSACGNARGREAAACASLVLAERIPLGEPRTEFVRVDFDPLAHFEEHMAGAPGHCLTRSAILATQLLSVGIPARVVQLVPAEGKGHTLVGVWDDSSGWLVVDPTTNGFVTWDGRRGSAPDLLTDPARVEWTPIRASTVSAAQSEETRRHFLTLLSGVVLYPEPWLYLRHGKRVAPWPYRGYYARIGPTILSLGPIQLALVWSIPTFALAGLSLLAMRRPGRVARPRTAEVRVKVGALGTLDAAPPG